jgi:hypothetical protein
LHDVSFLALLSLYWGLSLILLKYRTGEETREEVDKSSARSDEMGIYTFHKEVHFELNYAKKGVFYPPKAGLPPLIGGSSVVPFLYEFLKKGPILNYIVPKKGYFCPQKQGYPPWFEGPFLSYFCREYLKRALFWNNSWQNGTLLSLGAHDVYKVYLFMMCTGRLTVQCLCVPYVGE